jgi:general secretion pathway protein M
LTGTWANGRRGQALAVGVGFVLLAVIWFGIGAPLCSLFDERGILLDQRQTLLTRMQAVAADLPALRASASNLGQGNSSALLLAPGASDAVSAADLQQRVQKMADEAGVSLTAVETLPPMSAGNLRKVSLRITLNASWPVVTGLLLSFEQSPIRILVDDIHFRTTNVVGHPTVLPVQASMVLFSFRAANPDSRS